MTLGVNQHGRIPCHPLNSSRACKPLELTLCVKKIFSINHIFFENLAQRNYYRDGQYEPLGNLNNSKERSYTQNDTRKQEQNI